MSPVVSVEEACGGCFLYETRGVCPAARREYGFETPQEIQQRALALRAAIEQDAHAARSLYELIRRHPQSDSHRPAHAPRALPAPAETVSNPVAQEVSRVVVPCPS